MKTKSLIGVVAILAAMAVSANAAVIVDDFNGTTLDPMWTLDDDPASYDVGGGFSQVDGFLRFDSIIDTGYGHIETAVNTADGARVDAIMRSDNARLSKWGMGAGFYFDANNWASIKIVHEDGGTSGWSAMVMDNGALTDTRLQMDDISARFIWRIGGVEVTDTEVKFWASTHVWNENTGIALPNYSGVGAAGIDPNVTVMHSIAKPAAFTGNALAIIGKGFTDATFPNPDFDNLNLAAADNAYFSGIDLVRITTAAAPSVPGDFDGDGDVDGADFVAWQTHFPTASGATLADGDADGDGDVDGADFVVWQTNFPFTPAAGVAAVPEPHALILASIGVVIATAWRRKNHR